MVSTRDPLHGVHHGGELIACREPQPADAWRLAGRGEGQRRHLADLRLLHADVYHFKADEVGSGLLEIADELPRVIARPAAEPGGEDQAASAWARVEGQLDRAAQLLGEASVYLPLHLVGEDRHQPLTVL